ncbi:unnamed protein product [Clonostachys rhizophaga]|uniref:F-box domain-containing protein n=1 Tax=Clonostachys rhizophaga TaxID=160324 RepID=A0A9N9VGF6_9HYPO|nr:unnamed protein product [Clonostachys rhizophaga]
MPLSAIYAWFRQSKPRPTGLLDLPNELLIKIASLVDHRAIPALRLVCRRFDPVASPFLTLTIQVKQTQESLDDVQRLLERPHVASGIRAIYVHLRHRFSPLALDKSLFVQIFEDNVLPTRRYCCTVEEGRDHFMSDDYRWEKWPHMQVDKARPNDAKEKYEQLLLSAYEIYKKEYYETSRIVSERSLILALAKLVSFTKSPVALKFRRRTRLDCEESPHPESDLLNYLGSTNCLLALPTKYRKLLEVDVALHDGIIWDLPIALHQAGCIVDALRLAGVLNIMGDAVLFADALSPSNDSKKLNELRQALQNLTKFEIMRLVRMGMGQGDNPGLNHFAEPPVERLMFGDLLRTCLSGPGIERIRLWGESWARWGTWADPSRHEAIEDELTPVLK